MLRFAMVWLMLNILGFQLVSVFGLEVCGGDLPANPPGEINNPDADGDSKYEHNSECVWTITAKINKVIEIQFYYLETEGHPNMPCLYDYVQVFDGIIGDAIMGRFCGKELPETLISTKNVVTIVFKSDGSTHYHGFGIIYFEDELTLCGPLQDNLSELLTSHNTGLTGNYDDVKCTWKILIQPYTRKIQLYFLDMTFQSTENCHQGFVKVYDAKKVYGVHCGTHMPGVITSTSNYLLVDFQPESNILEESFEAIYVAIDADMQCGSILTTPTGHFLPADSDGNGYFDSDLHCVWSIVAPEDMGIQFDFESVDIQPWDYPDCPEDYVELFDGTFAPEASVGRLCGVLSPATIVTRNILFVHFNSDDSLNVVRGFEASFQHVPGTMHCGPVKTDLVGHFSSADINPDISYDLNLNCTWTIKLWLDPDKLIELYLATLNLPSPAEECGSDYLEVYDDSTNYGTYCGTSESQTIISTSNTLNVAFVSEGGINRKRFTAFYSAIDLDHQCGGILSSQTGSLTSVDRDQDGRYDPNLHCLWIIVAPEGRRIETELVKLDLYTKAIWETCWKDYLKLIDGGYQPGTYRPFYYEDRICGKDPLLPMVTESNFMYVLFHSDVENERSGFILNYNFTLAPVLKTKEITSSTGVVTATPDSTIKTSEEGDLHFSTNFSSSENDGRTTQKVETTTIITSTAASTISNDKSTFKETLSTEHIAKTQQGNASTECSTEVQISEMTSVTMITDTSIMTSSDTSVVTSSDVSVMTSVQMSELNMTTVSATSGIHNYDFILLIVVLFVF